MFQKLDTRDARFYMGRPIDGREAQISRTAALIFFTEKTKYCAMKRNWQILIFGSIA